MVHGDTLWVCLTYMEQSNKQRREGHFIFWAKVVQYWNLCPHLDYTFPSIGPHDLQLYQKDSTYKVHKKSYKIKVSKKCNSL